jgi:hypothetical protein
MTTSKTTKIDFEALLAELGLRANTNRAAVLTYLAKHPGEEIAIDRLAKAALGSADMVNSVTFAVGKLRERIVERKLSRKYSLNWRDDGENWWLIFSAL